MSELITLAFYTQTCVPFLFVLGRTLGKAAARVTIQRHLLRHETQISDRKALQQALELLGLKVQEGDPQQQWGGPVDLQVSDAQGKPWLAFGFDEAAGTYAIYRHDPAQSQAGLGEGQRLSDQDPMAILGLLSQQYGYLKTLRALLAQGYQTKGAVEVEADGSQTLVLVRQDSERNELHTVRLVFKAENGGAVIMTDSQRADGSHGVCPNLDPLLKSIGVNEFQKITSPAARSAREAHEAAEAARRQSARDPARTQGDDAGKETHRRKKTSGG